MMARKIVISECDPFSAPARAMADALWDEIQSRYGFTSANPFDPVAFKGPVGGFWVATDTDTDTDITVGSIALTPLSGRTAELDVMYVTPDQRGSGVARALLAALEEHARTAGVSVLRLRAGEPQPEALHFYSAAGFTSIPPFGKWVGDDTARCFEKTLK